MEDPEVETTVDPETGEPVAKKRRSNSDSDGHKVQKMSDIMNACYKGKFLPLADGKFTNNVFFQPVEVVKERKSWVDVKMRVVLLGSVTIEMNEQHEYAMESDDLLRMIYLADMFEADDIGSTRMEFEQWVLDCYSKLLAEDSHADYSDRARIANYMLRRNIGKLCLSSSGRTQLFFQKHCVVDFDMQGIFGTQTTTWGENANVVRGKSSRGKFEYNIEGHVICMSFGVQEGEERAKLMA